jgi:hypothetical protein
VPSPDTDDRDGEESIDLFGGSVSELLGLHGSRWIDESPPFRRMMVGARNTSQPYTGAKALVQSSRIHLPTRAPPHSP